MIENIRAHLFEMQDEAYRSFHVRLMPTVDARKVIGVRTPKLRAYAKELFGTAQAEVFLADLPHVYYEENNLHAFLIEQIRDYDACIAALDAFLPHVDNWATCDMMSPKVLKSNLVRLEEQSMIWMQSEHVYTVRYGIGMLLRWFSDAHFKLRHAEAVAAVKADDYYVCMMIAWYFATLLAFHYDEAVEYIENRRLPPWIHNKAVQKAVESNRIDAEHKQYLKKLKISARKQS